MHCAERLHCYKKDEKADSRTTQRNTHMALSRSFNGLLLATAVAGSLIYFSGWANRSKGSRRKICYGSATDLEKV